MFEFITIAVIAILGAMSPGPDFIVVTKNSITHSRSSGVFTAIGIALGIAIHSSYCILGLGLIISESLILFTIIKYIGAAYIIYLGIKGVLSKNAKKLKPYQHTQQAYSNTQSFKEGLLVNLLNPKCILFMLSIFTIVIKPATPIWVQFIYAAELAGFGFMWFAILSYLLTHHKIKSSVYKAQSVITKVLGAFLIGLGIKIALLHHR